MKPRIVVFLGPSLPREEAERILPACYLPPAAQGDVMGAVVGDQPDCIALIDGRTGDCNAVWPKELLFALEQGVALYGAAAHGALRAVEIPGMHGAGRVYELFAGGELEADDEVECSWIVENGAYRRLSHPLVNIRASLAKVVERGRLTMAEAEALMHSLSRLHFPERTTEAVMTLAAKRGEDVEVVVAACLAEEYVDIQAQDVRLLLERLSTATGFAEARPVPAAKSLFFQKLYHEDRKTTQDDACLPLYAIRNEMALSHPDAEDIVSTAGARSAAVELARQTGVQLTEAMMQAEERRFRKKRGIEDEAGLQAWLRENDLLEQDLRELLEQMALARAVFWMQGPRTRDILTELRLRGDYPEWKRKAAEVEAATAHCRNQALELYNSSTLQSLLQNYFRTHLHHWSVDPDAMMQEAGFRRDSLAWELARRVALAERTNAPGVEELLAFLDLEEDGQ